MYVMWVAYITPTCRLFLTRMRRKRQLVTCTHKEQSQTVAGNALVSVQYETTGGCDQVVLGDHLRLYQMIVAPR